MYASVCNNAGIIIEKKNKNKKKHLPCTHVQGVKQSVLSVCLFVSMKIARSGDLGI